MQLLQDGVPNLYEGDMSVEEEVLDWLIEMKVQSSIGHYLQICYFYSYFLPSCGIGITHSLCNDPTFLINSETDPEPV